MTSEIQLFLLVNIANKLNYFHFFVFITPFIYLNVTFLRSVRQCFFALTVLIAVFYSNFERHLIKQTLSFIVMYPLVPGMANIFNRRRKILLIFFLTYKACRYFVPPISSKALSEYRLDRRLVRSFRLLRYTVIKNTPVLSVIAL